MSPQPIHKEAQTQNLPLRIQAARQISSYFITGQKLDRRQLSKIMNKIYKGSDAANAWTWREAYDAVECAEILYISEHLKPPARKDPSQYLAELIDLQTLQPTQTIRSETQKGRQQYSTPAALAYLVSRCAQVGSDDVILEPSCGHGILALFAKLKHATLLLNEIDHDRAEAVKSIFNQTVYNVDAAYIDDLLPTPTEATLAFMNPPFSASQKRGKNRSETSIHIKSALKRLTNGGRLVAIVGYNFNPLTSTYAKAWDNILADNRLTASIGLSKQTFGSKGVSFATRIIVIDKGVKGSTLSTNVDSLDAALKVIDQIDPRSKNTMSEAPVVTAPAAIKKRPVRKGPILTLTKRSGSPINYAEVSRPKTFSQTTSIYVPYEPQRIKISDAKPHPDDLTQSVGLASVTPPLPTYRPKLPENIVKSGALSDAQLEAIIYAGEAHSKHLSGRFTYDPDKNNIALAPPNAQNSFLLRRGFAIGDGTGLGKGREIAGIILDNWINGRRKAIWISKSAELINDARRDLTALGFQTHEIFAQDDFDYGERISRSEGIIFTTFALIRGEAKDERKTRLQQLMDWAGPNFNGVITFDESHALQNALVTSSDRGEQSASLQGQAGLKLQFVLPDARIVYSSATSATKVENLSYMDRLGLWRGNDAPFDTRAEFISCMNDGGTAALELVARDLKAMGLYCARNISFAGVEYEAVRHELTQDQIYIYNQFADAFAIIHANLESVLEAINVKEDGKTKNRNAVGAARSAFESTKQRFFNHLLTSMKMPSVIKQMEADLENDFAIVGQIVSTGEAVLTRRLAQVSPADIIEGNVDLTPKDAVIEYLEHSFPTQLFEIVKSATGKETAVPVYHEDGSAAHSRDALQRKQMLIEQLCALPSIPSALDQLIWHFGENRVAEVTGRSKRIIKRKTMTGREAQIQSRPGSANRSELNAFMDGKKDIIVFSRSGSEGFSMHACLTRKNQKRRAQYVIEPGWSADGAIQGLGRSHRSNQAHPPLFRPVSTNVNGEKRFLSTISRRLNSLGALTKGERKTGGQNLFRPEDNLESKQAKEALQIFFRRLYVEPQNGITLKRFQDMTGLKLIDQDGTLLESLPTIQRFLNRLLALRIEDQNTLFTVFEEIIDNRIEAARNAGTLDLGAETIRADEVEVLSETILRIDKNNGAETKLIQIRRKTKTKPLTLSQLQIYLDDEHEMVFNQKSKKIGLVIPTTSLTDEATGKVFPRLQIITPSNKTRILKHLYDDMAWEPVDKTTFEKLWRSEINATPEFTIDEFGIVTGLIMPLWSLLSDMRQTVYRLRTETHGNILGRYIPPGMIQKLLQITGVDEEVNSISAKAVVTTVRKGEEFPINDNCHLKLSKVMDNQRIELKDYAPNWLNTLKSMGCFTEIIQFRTRVFIPNNDNAEEIIDKIMKRYISI